MADSTFDNNTYYLLGNLQTQNQTVSLNGVKEITLLAYHIEGTTKTYRQGFTIPRCALNSTDRYEINFYVAGRNYISVIYLPNTDALQLRFQEGSNTTGVAVFGK